MDNTNNQNTATSVEESGAILPVGWDESVDIFDGTWAKAAVDEPLESLLGTADNADANAEESSANGGDSTAEDSSEGEAKDQLATQADGDAQPKKFKFSTKVNHKNVDVELDESQLPELYQEAQGLKFAREKLDAMTPLYEKTEMVTELLGYKDIDEMLDAAKQAYIDNKKSKLVNERVHPEVANDIVTREVKDLEDKVIKARKSKAEAEEAGADKSTVASNGRDFKPEVAALLKKYPTLKGQTLPQEVVDKSVSTGEPLVSVYAEYKAQQAEAELARLRKDNKTLVQNAEAAKRAPVRGTAGGGTADTTASDPFLAGFNRH